MEPYLYGNLLDGVITEIKRCLFIAFHRIPCYIDVMDKFEELLNRYRNLVRLAEKTVRIGWIDGNGTARKALQNLKKRKRTGNPTPSIKAPVSNALIARTLNYGREEGVTAEGRHYPKIVARPFMTYAREGFDRIKFRILARYVPRILSGKMTVDQLADAFGKFYMDEVTRAIRDSEKYQGISEKTLMARRHHGNSSAIPLIDTHQLIDSVSFEVK